MKVFHTIIPTHNYKKCPDSIVEKQQSPLNLFTRHQHGHISILLQSQDSVFSQANGSHHERQFGTVH